MLTYKSPLFEAALDEAGITGAVRQRIIDQVVECGSCQGIAELPENVRNTFVVSGDVTVEEHVLTQASLQRFVDNSISKTVNFPETATVEDVRNAYLSAWSLGCKGLTVYVTGSRHNVVLETKSAKKNLEEKDKAAEAATSSSSTITQLPRSETLAIDTEGSSYEEDDDGDDEESRSRSNSGFDSVEKSPTPQKQSSSAAAAKTGAGVPSLSTIGPFLKKRPRPTHLQGMTYSADTPLGVAYITVNNTDNKEPFEVFLNVGKAGSDVSAVSEVIGRLNEVANHLEGIGGRKQKCTGKDRVLSLPDAIAKSLHEHMRH